MNEKPINIFKAMQIVNFPPAAVAPQKQYADSKSCSHWRQYSWSITFWDAIAFLRTRHPKSRHLWATALLALCQDGVLGSVQAMLSPTDADLSSTSQARSCRCDCILKSDRLRIRPPLSPLVQAPPKQDFTAKHEQAATVIQTLSPIWLVESMYSFTYTQNMKH